MAHLDHEGSEHAVEGCQAIDRFYRGAVPYTRRGGRVIVLTGQ
jgi:hypothetical protein